MISGGPCIRPAEAVVGPRCPRRLAGLLSGFGRRRKRRHRGENKMQRVVLLCTALAFGVCGSPVAAQQTVPEQPPQQAQPTGPTEPASPGAQSTPDMPSPPPPFPPMPRAPSHRWVDVSSHHSSHRRAHTPPSHRRHVEATHRGRHGERTQASHRSRHAEAAEAHLSKRTIRSCHRMSYKQIMRQSDCRALMSQELAASHHRERHSAHRHRGTTHRHTATHRHHHKR